MIRFVFAILLLVLPLSLFAGKHIDYLSQKQRLELALRSGALSDKQKADTLEQLGRLNLTLLLSKQAQPESREVEVGEGDTLGKIASAHNTTKELIAASNQLRGETVWLGAKLKVVSKPWKVVVDKSDNRLTLYLDGQFFKEYRVSTGRNSITPNGQYKIANRIVHPSWLRPTDKKEILYGDPEHPIGTHWLGWDKEGFGLHGTNRPDQLGRQVSSGCVRLHNRDVGELYLLLPVGTPIVVMD